MDDPTPFCVVRASRLSASPTAQATADKPPTDLFELGASVGSAVLLVGGGVSCG
jgi:hypothetical protein